MSDAEPGLIVEYCPHCTLPPEYCEYGGCYERKCKPWLEKYHPELLVEQEKKKNKAEDAEEAEGPEEAEEAGDAGGEGTDEESDDGSKKKKKKKKKKMKKKKEADMDDEFLEGLEDLHLEQEGEEKAGPPEEAGAEDNGEAVEADVEDDVEDEESDAPKKKKKKSKRGGASVVKEEKRVPMEVVLRVDQRNKRKFLSIVSGIDTTELNPKKVSQKLAKKFACSSAVTKGNQGQVEIQLQGDVIREIAEFLVQEFELPEECIYFATKGEKKKKAFPKK